MPGAMSEAAANSQSRTLFLTDADVTALSDWPSAIDALRRAYASDVDPQSVPPRSMARAPGMWLRSLTAISPLEGYLGCKLIAACLPIRTASYLVSLFDKDSAQLHALIDGNQITGIRTAATSAVAVDALAPQRPLRLGILGSGFEARAQLTALATVRAIQRAKVYSPTAANRAKFAAHFEKTSRMAVQAVDTPEAALEEVDVVICAARGKNEEPVLRGRWLVPGTMVVSIGSTLPEQREVDVEVIRRAKLIVADMPDEVARDTGDLIAATRESVTFAEKLISLHELCRVNSAVGRSADDIVLYKSVGSALQDVVVAEMLFLRARERGLGSFLPVSIAPVRK